MRALLPFSDTQSRSFIHAYEGPAPVIDVRTICIRPNITNTRIPQRSEELRSEMHGNISVPNDLLPTLLAATPLRSFKPTMFACRLSFNFALDSARMVDDDNWWDDNTSDITSAWDLTICTFGGYSDVYLKTAFAYRKRLHSPSTPFLLINYTGYGHQQVQNRTKFPPLELANFNDTTPGLHYHHRNEWLDLKQDAQTLDWSDGNNFADTKLSFSLCLPVFQGWFLNIAASSQAPLEEAMYSYDTERSQFRYDQVRKQLLRSSIPPLEERNVLSLHPKLWSLDEQDDPFGNFGKVGFTQYPFGSIRDIVTLPSSETENNPPTLNLVDEAIDLQPRSDKNIGGLGLEILQEGGTPAEAMQSMLMSVVLSGYQQYVFTNVSNGTPNSIAGLRSDFITAQVPGGNGRPATNPAGATPSYVIVMIATAIHSFTVLVIIILFIRGTKNALIWESWHTVAQSISAITEPYLSQASFATDSEIKKQMKIDGTSSQAVSMRTDDSGVRAEVGVVRQRLKSTRVQKDPQSDLLMEELRPVKSVKSVRNVER
jgi:hypothetical protein